MRPPARTRPGKLSLTQLFAAPALVAAASVAGLVIGLTGHGTRDWLSWVLLTIPLAAVAWATFRRG